LCHIATWLALALLLFSGASFPQVVKPKAIQRKAPPETPPPEAPPLEAPKDTLGRTSPRGTVLGFLAAARKGNSEIAALYLNTSLRGEPAQALARQLAIVLDRRLPARLNELSDQPEGSAPDPLKPDEDIVGTISTSHGDLDIILERIDRGKVGRVWLFSKKTLESIPPVYEEVSTPTLDQLLPKFFVNTRIATIPLFQWLAVFVGLPFLYFLTGVPNRAAIYLSRAVRRRSPKRDQAESRKILVTPVRLLLLAMAIRWLLSRFFGTSLLARQFWSTTAFVIASSACVWLVIDLNAWGERYLVDRYRRLNLSGSASVLRLVRRVIDVAAIFGGLLFALHHFGVNPTAALAGLGVGGIAVALAAQKTLENVIGGVSLIADRALIVGETLKLGDVVGTIEEVGVRSTRIRTLGRTVVTVPNGQIANMSLESYSARDKFWFHPVLALRYETATFNLRLVLDNTYKLLNQHRSIESASVRVRFVKLSTYSLDVEIVAYVLAGSWDQFLEIQEQLLLAIVDLVRDAGAQIAFSPHNAFLPQNQQTSSAA